MRQAKAYRTSAKNKSAIVAMQQFSGKGQRFLVLVQFAQYLIHTAALARWQNAPKNIRNRLNGFPVWLGLNSPG